MYGATITLGGVAALDIRAADPGLSAGTLNSFGASPPSPGDTIAGPISCAGTINIGTGAAAATTLTVGGALSISGTLNMKGAILARGANAVALSGTLNSVGGSGGLGDAITGGGTFTCTGVINVGVGGPADVTLTVASAVTVTGSTSAVNLYDATISTAGLTLSGGTLTSNGGSGSSSGVGDAVSGGPLTNNGTIRFAGALHSLTLSGGDYTQGAAGTLSMRISAGPSNDKFFIGGTATLGGTLIVTAQGNLPAATWTIISATGGIVGTFDIETVPPGYEVTYGADNVNVEPA
jgi:hypothetical protein